MPLFKKIIYKIKNKKKNNNKIFKISNKIIKIIKMMKIFKIIKKFIKPLIKIKIIMMYFTKPDMNILRINSKIIKLQIR